MSSNTSTVSTPIESMEEGRSPCFEADVPMTYHTKQFLFAIGSPDFPAITCISFKASAKYLPINYSTVSSDRCNCSEIDLKWGQLSDVVLETVLAGRHSFFYCISSHRFLNTWFECFKQQLRRETLMYPTSFGLLQSSSLNAFWDRVCQVSSQRSLK